MASNQKLEDIAGAIRRRIFNMICDAGGGHIAPSFSVVEIMTALYFQVMKYDPANPRLAGRDRFILSKGHAAVALYAVLMEAGIMPESTGQSFCQSGGKLGGHPNLNLDLGIEATTGALGHGFAFGVGIACGARLDHSVSRIFAVLGDGECQEGSVWEAAAFAAHHKLDNLTVIVDYNKLQALDRLDRIQKMEPLADRWRAFGWETREVDGHHLGDMLSALGNLPLQADKPSCIIAHTIKGKGISFMENVPIWHYRLPQGGEMETARQELGIT